MEWAENMVKRPSTTCKREDCSNFFFYSTFKERIENTTFDMDSKASGTYVSHTIDDAHYDKNGRAVRALDLNWKKYWVPK